MSTHQLLVYVQNKCNYKILNPYINLIQNICFRDSIFHKENITLEKMLFLQGYVMKTKFPTKLHAPLHALILLDPLALRKMH